MMAISASAFNLALGFLGVFVPKFAHRFQRLASVGLLAHTRRKSFPTLDHALSYYSDIQHWLYAA